jgi:hypothetical protein
MVGKRKQHRLIDDYRLEAKERFKKRMRKQGILITKLKK